MLQQSLSKTANSVDPDQTAPALHCLHNNVMNNSVIILLTIKQLIEKIILLD